MNLLDEDWIPVRDRNGQRRWARPHALSSDDIVAFDADRPDFNGALAQFMIGLLQTTSPVDSPVQWRRHLQNPPDAATLQAWFEPVRAAFKLDGTGPRFMQDIDLGSQGVAVNGIEALLIDKPGENTVKNNTDHFVKRASGGGMCPHCAATALFTLQINAPSGGAGHRTGLRGGGPLTTLVLHDPPRTLWHDLWLNVLRRAEFLSLGADPAQEAPHSSFPWLAPTTALQAEGGQLTPAQVHPAHVFWAMPRRIRLDFEHAATGRCGVCGRVSDRLLTTWATKNHGLNYKGPWEHPLSPYYEAKDVWLPLHPQPGGIGYRHWLAWVLGADTDKKVQRNAAVVRRAQTLQGLGSGIRLWAFGYDMDNMKARCWYESTLPLYGLADCAPDAQRDLQAEVGRWLAAAEMVAFFLRSAVKDAWFSADARGDLSAIDASFWGRTEHPFYAELRALLDALHSGAAFDALAARQRWQRNLGSAAQALFDHTFVGCGPVERGHPRRTAMAWQQLDRNLRGPKLRQSLGLPEPAGAARLTRKASDPQTSA